MKRQEITESNAAYKSVELGTVTGLFIGFSEVSFSWLFPFSFFLRGISLWTSFLFCFLLKEIWKWQQWEERWIHRSNGAGRTKGDGLKRKRERIVLSVWKRVGGTGNLSVGLQHWEVWAGVNWTGKENSWNVLFSLKTPAWL